MRMFSIIKNRIVSPYKYMIKEFRNKQYKLGFLRFLSAMTKDSFIGKKFNKKVHNTIIRQLEREYAYVLCKYKDYKSECVYDCNAPVWVCWMQGYDKSPKIVKKCIDSIKKSTLHPVYIVTEDNLDTYYVFPDYIMDKYKNGIISNAQFSDILRMTLLSEYGGLWIDATIYVPNKLPEEIFMHEFYTCKRKPMNSGYVSNYMWTSFLNGCQRNCIIQKINKELFFEYWKRKNYLIDYLLVDYFMMIVFRNSPYAKKLIDELPYNNPLVEELQNRMSLPYDENEYNKLVNDSNTSLFKLSWRMDFEKMTKSGEATYFSNFIDLK